MITMVDLFGTTSIAVYTLRLGNIPQNVVICQ